MNVNDELMSLNIYELHNINQIKRFYNKPPFYFYIHVRFPCSFESISICTPEVNTIEELPNKIGDIILNNKLLKYCLSLYDDNNEDEKQVYFDVTLLGEENLECFKMMYTYNINDLRIFYKN